MRSLCLKIISLVLNKYEDHEFCSDLWDRFFSAVKSLVEKFKQESASSEKPSSLLSCFLSMSANNKLVALLCWKENLVPDIFSIISVSSASEAVIYCVLKFVENLLSLDNQFNGEDNAAQGVLLSNIKVLMDSMCCLFRRDNAIRRYTSCICFSSHYLLQTYFNLLSLLVASNPVLSFWTGYGNCILLLHEIT